MRREIRSPNKTFLRAPNLSALPVRPALPQLPVEGEARQKRQRGEQAGGRQEERSHDGFLRVLLGNGIPLCTLSFCLLIFLVSCRLGGEGQIVSPDETVTEIRWSKEDLRRDVAVKFLTKTDEASLHLVRLRGAEKPHVHDRHDLTVFVLKGKARLHLAGRTSVVKKGDLIVIPRGTVHWAESKSHESTEAYAVFSPPFDGEDHREVSLR